MAELLVAVAIIGILAAISAPYFLTYLQSARVRAAAQEVATVLNRARQLAISTNHNVCVQVPSVTALQYRLASCTGDVWAGPGTTAAGHIAVPAGITLTTSADPLFSYLGNATPGATYTVTDTQSGKTRQVALAASGRVSIGP